VAAQGEEKVSKRHISVVLFLVITFSVLLTNTTYAQRPPYDHSVAAKFAGIWEGLNSSAVAWRYSVCRHCAPVKTGEV
jgi:hypothetical protein